MTENLTQKTNAVLRSIGITCNTIPYSVLCWAIELIDEQKDRLQAVEKQIYTPIADGRRYSDVRAVHSAIRRAAKKAWELCPERVQELAGYPLSKCPSAVAFLEMIYNAITQME